MIDQSINLIVLSLVWWLGSIELAGNDEDSRVAEGTVYFRWIENDLHQHDHHRCLAADGYF